MTWSNDDEETSLQVISSNTNQVISTEATVANARADGIDDHDAQVRTVICPSCGITIKLQHQSSGGLIQNLPGLPAGVKFDPSDQEILQHLEAKVLSDLRRLHPLIDEFIPTIDGENGICYTHPEKLPGVNKDGQVRHFFHRPSKAYTTGTRKRRKVHTDIDGGETRWHKTGKTRPVTASGSIKGYKKILVLYTNYGRQRKPEKTNWVMHQYHLGNNEEEKDGEFVISKVFYQTHPRRCGSSATIKEAAAAAASFKPMPSAKSSGTMAGFVEYYNPSPPFMSAAYICNRDSTAATDGHHQLMQNLVVHGDGSSFVHLPSSASKGK